MKKLDLSTDVQKQIADLYTAGKSYEQIRSAMKEKGVIFTDHAITVIRNRFKLKVRRHHKSKGNGFGPSLPPPRKLKAPHPSAEAEAIIQTCIRKLRALERPPLCVLIDPKEGTYRIQTSVEFEGKVQ